MALVFSAVPTLPLLQLGIQGRMGKIGSFSVQMKREICFYHNPKCERLTLKPKIIKRHIFLSSTAGLWLKAVLCLRSKSSSSWCSCPIGTPRGSRGTFGLGADGCLQGNNTLSLHYDLCKIL